MILNYLAKKIRCGGRVHNCADNYCVVDSMCYARWINIMLRKLEASNSPNICILKRYCKECFQIGVSYIWNRLTNIRKNNILKNPVPFIILYLLKYIVRSGNVRIIYEIFDKYIVQIRENDCESIKLLIQAGKNGDDVFIENMLDLYLKIMREERLWIVWLFVKKQCEQIGYAYVLAGCICEKHYELIDKYDKKLPDNFMDKIINRYGVDPFGNMFEEIFRKNVLKTNDLSLIRKHLKYRKNVQYFST